ncbi:MAG: tetratricopeptide repeat protein, partial [Actinobacteria bacterium]|nr:tetratricopeptide repeat protein [Actinomycetota bacterium]
MRAIFVFPGCDKLNEKFHNLLNIENAGNEETPAETIPTETIDSASFGENDSSSSKETYPLTESKDQEDQSQSSGTEISQTQGSEGMDTENLESENLGTTNLDIERQRKYFIEGLKHLQDNSYLLAEYYFLKIEDSYKILQDHVLYYLAKSLLLQEKFSLSEKYYLKLIYDFPDSIWKEKANLDYADLLYLEGNFLRAEEAYQSFLRKFQSSEYIPYCLYQLAVCQEKNKKYQDSYNNYVKIYLDHPYNEYSETAFESLSRLSKEEGFKAFVPSASQIFIRGQILFSRYLYKSAIQEFNRILEKNYLPNLTQELHSKTLFKLGMCYYNLRNYQKSKEYLSLAYEKFPSTESADDCLYFLGRVFTNLGLLNEAISSYQKLLSHFPTSEYNDDALYRLGRIYYILEDWQNAKNCYNRIINEYKSSNIFADALWELGWIQYRIGEHTYSIDTFSKLQASYKGSQLEEKALFWKAKNYQKLGEIDKAIQTYQAVVNLNSYSYYTFKSRDILEELGVKVKIPEIDSRLNPENPQHKNLIPEIYQDLDTEIMAKDKASFKNVPYNEGISITSPSTASSIAVSTKEGESNKTGNPAKITQITHIDKAKELLNLKLYDSASLEIEAGKSELEEKPIGILELSTLFL